ncbi:MAG: cupin domain-containing protein [bacterium]|nr:cupin domain-containing protein [bacterium]
MDTQDYGPKPHVVDIERATTENSNFRTTHWTGTDLQLTLMSIPPGEDIGLEVHPDNDQFLRLEQGRGRCQMGPSEDDLSFDEEVADDWAIFVPKGTWHNVTNTGEVDMRLYAIYGPAHHPNGTIHATQEEAEEDEHDHGH